MKYKTVQERDNFNPSNHYFYVFTKTKQWFLFEVESKNKNIDILKEAVKSFCRAQNRPIEMIDVIHNAELRGAKPIGEASLSNDVLGEEGG